MAGDIGLPIKAAADIDTPATGKYNLFLNSADSDQLYKKDSAGASTPVVSGGGTVSTISVVSANGLAGTVANPATTPAITLSTTITGILKGNGTAISAASASDITGQLLTGYVSGAGVLAATDTILQGFNKLNGNIGALVTGVSSVTGSGNIASSGGATPNITFTGTLPIASGGTNLSALGTALQQLRVNAGATALEYFTPASGGITIGSTTITSGTDNRILFQDATASDFVTQTANFTMGAVASGYLDVPSGYALAGHVLLKEVNTTSIVIGNTSGTSMTGAGNTVLGYQNGVITNGTNNTYIGATATTRANNNGASYNTTLGYGIDINSTTGYNVVIGAFSGVALTGYYNTIMGIVAGCSGLSGTGNIFIGAYAGELSTSSISNSICIGANSFSSATGQLVLGGANSHGVSGVITDVFLNNPTSTSPASVILNACGGSGSNIAGAELTIAGGKGTGTGAGGNIVFQTSTVGSSGTTLQTLATRFTIEKLRVTAAVPIKLMGYTVATLPAAPSVGDMAYCTDLLTPTFFTVAVGGGAVTGIVFYDGTIWKT